MWCLSGSSLVVATISLAVLLLLGHVLVFNHDSEPRLPVEIVFNHTWPDEQVALDVNTTLLAMKIAVLLQHAKCQHGQCPSYGHFADGNNGFHGHTKSGVLIIESYYNTQFYKIYTPLGYWTLDVDDWGEQVQKQLPFKMELIAPQYNMPKWGLNGGWYLVTEVDGVPLQDYSVVPFRGNRSRLYSENDCDHEELVVPRLKWLESFFKPPASNRLARLDESKLYFERMLQMAFQMGLWDDPTGMLRALYHVSDERERTAILSRFDELCPQTMDATSYRGSRRASVATKQESYRDFFWLLCDCRLYRPVNLLLGDRAVTTG